MIRLEAIKSRFFKLSTFQKALMVAVTYQMAMTLIGLLLAPSQGLLGHMYHWDSGWYKNIIDHRYLSSGSPASPVFYPIYPIAVGFISFLSFNTVTVVLSGLIVNTLATWMLILALVGILKKFRVNKYGIIGALIFLLSFPSGFFLHVFYTESLFMALGFWAYLFALRRNWRMMAVMLIFTAAARLPGILFILLCGLEFLVAHEWKFKKILNRQALWFIVAPLGLILYGLYLNIIGRGALGMLNAYSSTTDWDYQKFNPNILQTISVSIRSGISDIATKKSSYEPFINRLLPASALIGVMLSSVYLLIRDRVKYMPLAITGLASIVMFSLNSNLRSVHRYTLACLGIYLAVALICNNRRRLMVALSLCSLSFILQIFLYSRFINNIFAG